MYIHEYTYFSQSSTSKAMETKSVDEVSTLLPKEKQGEVDYLFKYLVKVYTDIEQNLITIKYNYINGQTQLGLLYRELDSYFEKRIWKSEFTRPCHYCRDELSGLRKFSVEIKDKKDYEKVVQEFKYIQDFAVKYMCFLSRSRNFGDESTSNSHLEFIKEEMKSSIILEDMYEKLSRKYLNKMIDSEPITRASLASQLCDLNHLQSCQVKHVLNVQVLSKMLLYFLANKIDVPPMCTKSNATDEAANAQVIKIMSASLKELIDELKSLRMHQKTYTEDINAIKKFLKDKK